MKENWVPEVGKLVARIEINEHSTEVLICYRLHDGDEMSYATICQILDDSAAPLISEFFESTAEQAVAFSAFKRTIHRHYVRAYELRLIKTLWRESPGSFANWLQQVNGLPILSELSKEQVFQIQNK